MVNSNKISIDLHLNEKLYWANQFFDDLTKHFSGCVGRILTREAEGDVSPPHEQIYFNFEI